MFKDHNNPIDEGDIMGCACNKPQFEGSKRRFVIKAFEKWD